MMILLRNIIWICYKYLAHNIILRFYKVNIFHFSFISHYGGGSSISVTTKRPFTSSTSVKTKSVFKGAKNSTVQFLNTGIITTD